jgi:hypothetical protein
VLHRDQREFGEEARAGRHSARRHDAAAAVRDIHDARAIGEG